MSKDIIVQQIPLNPEANYHSKQAMPTSEVDESYKKYILYNTPTNVTEDRNRYRYYDDRYPMTVLEVIRESNTAKAVYETRSRFIAGSGASNEDMGKFVVNPKDGTTVNDLIHYLAPDSSKQKQAYLWVKLNENLNGDIYSLERIAPQNARLGKPRKDNTVTRVLYSPYAFGTSDWNSYGRKAKSYPFYSEEKTAANQIYYYNFDKEYNEYYPYPFSNNQLELFRTDSKITSFHYNNLKNNFFGGALISIVGDPNRKVKIGEDSDGKDIYDTWGNVMANELGNTKAGADNAGNMTLLWSNPDSPQNTQAPIIQPITTNTQGDIFSQTQADITDNIARVANVPTILANIQVSGKLGNSEELINSIDLLIASTDKERRAIERILNPLLKKFPEWQRLFGDEDLIIQPPTPIRLLPEYVWAEMSQQERRDFISKNFSIELEEIETTQEVQPTQEVNTDLEEATAKLQARVDEIFKDNKYNE